MITAVLLAWHRPGNIQRIVAQLAALDCIGEILVWRNDPAVTLHLATPKARIIDSPSNLICAGRFACAAQARHPLIYVQDDDVLVQDVPELLQRFLADPTRIHFNLSEWHYARRERHFYGDCHSALIGWGAIFPKEWLAVLDTVPETIRATRLFQREADQYFTLLLRRHHMPWRGRLVQLEGHSTPGQALWLAPEHGVMASLAVREALGLARRASRRGLPALWHVVIPCHNHGAFLAEAAESVMLNDADYEVTVVDDASTDDTPAVAAGLQQRYPHLRYIRKDTCSDAAAARNTGIASLDSAYVALLDADDRFGPDYLFEAGRLLARDADIANPSAHLFGEVHDCWQPPATTTLPMLLKHNSIHYCSAFRRSWWAEIGGFDEALSYCEDYDFWIRLLARGARARMLPGEHFFYRCHAASKTNGSRYISEDSIGAVRHKHRHLYAAQRRAG